jgi:hypothetical protein
MSGAEELDDHRSVHEFVEARDTGTTTGVIRRRRPIRRRDGSNPPYGVPDAHPNLDARLEELFAEETRTQGTEHARTARRALSRLKPVDSLTRNRSPCSHASRWRQRPCHHRSERTTGPIEGPSRPNSESPSPEPRRTGFRSLARTTHARRAETSRTTRSRSAKQRSETAVLRTTTPETSRSNGEPSGGRLVPFES